LLSPQATHVINTKGLSSNTRWVDAYRVVAGALRRVLQSSELWKPRQGAYRTLWSAKEQVPLRIKDLLNTAAKAPHFCAYPTEDAFFSRIAAQAHRGK
jgi:hypothetical protein